MKPTDVFVVVDKSDGAFLINLAGECGLVTLTAKTREDADAVVERLKGLNGLVVERVVVA